jgi:hypothetical protein
MWMIPFFNWDNWDNWDILHSFSKRPFSEQSYLENQTPSRIPLKRPRIDFLPLGALYSQAEKRAQRCLKTQNGISIKSDLKSQSHGNWLETLDKLDKHIKETQPPKVYLYNY